MYPSTLQCTAPPQLCPAAELELCGLLWQKQGVGVQLDEEPAFAPLPAQCVPVSVGRAGPSAGLQGGAGEAEGESGLWDQSVQRCFSCACASSVLTLGSEVGRASQDMGQKLELELGRGASGSRSLSSTQK